jgi:hypothetical protein
MDRTSFRCIPQYSNAHRGVARKREIFLVVPPEDEPPDP